MTIYITKENELNIPMGTFLHFLCFHDRPNPNNTWKSITFYAYEDKFGNIVTHTENEIVLIEGCYKNAIRASWVREWIFEGEEYWKVFVNEQEARYHKLEFVDGKHYSALIHKPYRDIVYWNTNSEQSQFQRFRTEKEAIEYCYCLKNNLSYHDKRTKIS